PPRMLFGGNAEFETRRPLEELYLRRMVFRPQDWRYDGIVKVKSFPDTQEALATLMSALPETERARFTEQNRAYLVQIGKGVRSVVYVPLQAKRLGLVACVNPHFDKPQSEADLDAFGYKILDHC